MFETGPGEVDKYIIYCNGEKIGESKTTAFSDNAERNSTDRYAVTALFVNGNESAPQYINADGSSGIFDIEAAASLRADVYNLQRHPRAPQRRHRRARSLPAGIYVVGGRKLHGEVSTTTTQTYGPATAPTAAGPFCIGTARAFASYKNFVSLRRL